MKENGVEQVSSLLFLNNYPSVHLSESYPISPYHLKVVLETEYDNAAALALYESLGFIREKRLYRFYMNGKDAFRLVLSVPAPRASSAVNSSPLGSLTLHGDAQGHHGLANLRKAPLLVQSGGRAAMYNTRVVPEFIAGFDDSDSDDEVSRR